jgi:uncharacterized protein (TIGR00661 family)
MLKKFIIAVQGEGRGHMTQALSLYDMLTEAGHTVSAVILGSSGTRDVPKFFFEKINCPIYQLKSPNFISDAKNKSINLRKSIFHNLKQIGTFKQSLKKIDEILKEHQPDTIINLYDLLMGLYYRFYKPKIKMVCLAHQYIYLHPEFEFPEGRRLDRMAIRFYTRLTSYGSSKNLGLSFYRIHTHDQDVTVVPPLLRKEIFDLQVTPSEFYLVYLVNRGYFEEVLAWHKNNPTTVIHCFTDQADKLHEEYTFDNQHLHLHAINDKLFLEMMSQSKGLASSAGFESVCEAMYLGKPVLMVPIAGHYEQFCNSRDAHKAGAGIFADSFDLGQLHSFSAGYDKEDNKWFQNWVSGAKPRIYQEILSV